MKKTKAFTLVELLAVIVILAVVLLIAVPGVLGIIKNQKEESYQHQLRIIKEAARNYVVAERTLPFKEFSDKKQATISLAELQKKGYLDKKIIDPRNKTEIKDVAVLVTQGIKKEQYEIVFLDSSNTNYPSYSSNTIPIVYDGTNWVKADVTNKNLSWFNYDKQQWANIATVKEETREGYLKAKVGTVVKMSDINGMFVWIPRFKYKLWNVDGTLPPSGNTNLEPNNQIIVVPENKTTPKSTDTQNGEWLTHPAFTFAGEELDGIWFGKFTNTNLETENNTCTGLDNSCLNDNHIIKISIVPNRNMWRYQSVAYAFDSILAMKEENNVYGLTDAEDPHMMKNMEWGALVYLTNSKYGKTGNSNYSGVLKEVTPNSSFTTGEGDYKNKQAQSTTGNITGVYDASGGAWEYAAGVVKQIDGNGGIVLLSDFTQDRLNAYINEGKYIEAYNYSINTGDITRGYLGDATKELGPIIKPEPGRYHLSSWYDDFGFFPYMNMPWFTRGGKEAYGRFNGVSAFSFSNGKSGWNSWNTYGSRTVIK